jgi:hypothetical protein
VVKNDGRSRADLIFEDVCRSLFFNAFTLILKCSKAFDLASLERVLQLGATSNLTFIHAGIAGDG